jgi:hypothetical protein
MESSDPSERTALKEWAVLVEAMARGDITAMVRKGGIHEQRSGFRVRHDRFLMYPTFFHEKLPEVAPRLRHLLEGAHASRPPDGTVRFTHMAEVVALWNVDTLDPLRAIGEYHGLDWSAVESRFNYKGKPGVKVVAVRTMQLARAVEVPEVRRYSGCISWVELDSDVNVADARPVLAIDRLERAVESLTEVLGKPLDNGE